VKGLRRLVFGSGGKSASARDAEARVIIFDFDGTIADTFSVAVDIFNELGPSFGFPPLTPDLIDKARGMTAHQLIDYFGIKKSNIPSIAARGLKALHSRMPEVEPCAGVPALIRRLSAEGYVLGILTSNSSENVEDFLRRHDLKLFSFVRCSSRIFGKDKELSTILKTNHWNAGQILFVGDEVRDIEAGQKVGVRCAAVTWGYNTREALEKLAPDLVVDRPDELMDL